MKVKCEDCKFDLTKSQRYECRFVLRTHIYFNGIMHLKKQEENYN